MNLYSLHDKPEDLHKHKEADMQRPELFWNVYRHDPNELKKREDAIATDSWYAYHYAKEVLKGPFPKGEKAIFTNSLWRERYKTLISGNN